MKHLISLLLPICIAALTSCFSQKKPMVTVQEIQGKNKVEVTIDGQPFTSYMWPENMEKPVLYPLRTAKSTFVTRGFPLYPRPGERVDHPHHVGSWLNYGNVNGLDFWNNSYAVPDERKHKYGKIVHEKVLSAQSGEKSGKLEVICSWQNSDGDELLKEKTKLEFLAGDNYRSIERITRLTASNQKVDFKDNKEGLFAIRMDRAFEFPTEEPRIFIDDDGNPSEVKVINNEGVNGKYLSSKGKTGAGVWGTRANWMSLSAEKDGEKISVVILDHPENPGYPTYWHARTYGLFSANPLGQAAFTDGKKKLNLSLEPGESVEFRYKIFIKSGEYAKAKELDKLQAAFSKK